MQRKSFSNSKFKSMLLTGTFTMAAMYLMLLADSIIAGFFLGEDGVAAVNLIAPLTGIVSFLSAIVSIGTSILYSRRIGKMDQEGANRIYGQGLIVSVVMAVVSAFLLYIGRDAYFSVSGASGAPYEYALKYYRFLPLNAVLTIMIQYLSNMVYMDGDETVNNLSYGLQLGGNIILSVILCRSLGMTGIILGTVIGNAAGILALLSHFLRKSNTLHFTWYFSFKDLGQAIRFSAVDATIYVCWGVMDYVLISYIARHFDSEVQVVLAVIINLIEFCVVMDGVGLAVQPLVGTYIGEKNHTMIKRAIKAAALEGIVATVLVFIFAKQFALLFGIRDAMILAHCVKALRIVCLSMTFCSLLSLTTSYYMLIEHIGLSTVITVFKDGVLYTLLPLLLSLVHLSEKRQGGISVAVGKHRRKDRRSGG